MQLGKLPFYHLTTPANAATLPNFGVSSRTLRRSGEYSCSTPRSRRVLIHFVPSPMTDLDHGSERRLSKRAARLRPSNSTWDTEITLSTPVPCLRNSRIDGNSEGWRLHL